jgi:hypothetical protein
MIKINHFTSCINKPLQVKQLNGSTAKALGNGLKLLQYPVTKTIIPLWPTYFMPTNCQCTFSPTALRHYLHCNDTTEHLNFPSIITTSGITLRFSSLKNHTNHQLLDYHEFTVVKPQSTTIPKPSPIINNATSESPLTRLLVHQRMGQNCDIVLDSMCHW